MHGPFEVVWREGGMERRAGWRSPSQPPPTRVGLAGDRTTAAEGLARARRGEALLYRGDFRNARQLLAAMGRRLSRPRRSGAREAEGAAAWRAERERRRAEHEVLSRLLVPVEAGWRIPLPRAPAVDVPLAEALGPAPERPGVLPLREVLGMVGAHEWRSRGVLVPALGARVHPHYGVWAPVRAEHVDLVAEAASGWSAAGKRALDVGTGTGVLALVLARAGADVVATDLEPRAIACARENAERLGLAARIELVCADLFPPPGGSFDLVVSNPPWLPDEARSPLERAVYDPGGAFVERLVLGLPARLAPGGEAWIVISDLAELLGLRAEGWLAALADRAGLRIAGVGEARPSHPRSRDRTDPLHAFRARERTRLHRLVGGR